MKIDWKHIGRKLLSKGFWAALLLGLVPLLAQSLGWDMIGNYDTIVNMILGLLATIGLLHNPDPRSDKEKQHWINNI